MTRQDVLWAAVIALAIVVALMVTDRPRPDAVPDPRIRAGTTTTPAEYSP